MDVFILDSATLEKIGVVDQSYSSLRWTRRLYAPDSFEMIINRRRLYASELKTKRLLFMPSEGNLCFFIEQTGVRFEGSHAGDLVKVRGRSIEGPALTKRRVIPPTGQSHDRQTSVAAETAMKHYVDAHAGPGAAVARRIPNLAIAADQARGITVTVEARHQAVADILREIGLAAAMGWQITFDQAAASYIFDVVVGVDRSTSVFFDPAFETLEAWEELDSIADSDTVAYVAGQGEGVDREIVTRWRGVEPTGFDRREAFLDARDVELGLTAVLNHRGDAHLEATAPEVRYEAKVHHFGSFRYRTDWDLGDLIRLRNEQRGISQPARVVEVESIVDRSSSAPERTAVLDRPFPTLKERVTGGGVGGSVQDRPVTLPPDPHAASHGIGAADAIVELTGRGTAFPAQPAYGNGRPFYRTDRDLWYAYDGVRWLCTCPHVAFVSRPGTFTSGENLIGRIPHPGKSAALNIYVTRLHWSMYFLGSGNDASNRWLCRFYSIDGTTMTLEGSQETDSEGATIGQKTVTRLLNVGFGDGTYEAFDMRIAEQGAPSDVADISGSIEWRYMG